MKPYIKESIKNQYKSELSVIYKQMLEEEEAELKRVNELWRMLQTDLLKAIALYDVATTGGVNKDLNTLNVEIITKIEQFKACDMDSKRLKQVHDLESNINALQRLIKNSK